MKAHHRNRPGSNAAIAAGAGSPDIMAAIASPVTGAMVIPSIACPVATHTFRSRGTRPSIGNPSGATKSAPGEGGPTLMSQLDSVTGFVKELKALFGVVNRSEVAGAGQGPQLVTYFEPARMLVELTMESAPDVTLSTSKR